MITFLISLVVLIVGFALYSKLIEKVFRVDDRQTPAVAHPDGVDYTPMKTWRLFLIQLLNIAGLGPIFGALAGACWGPRVYLWIVFGTIRGRRRASTICPACSASGTTRFHFRDRVSIWQVHAAGHACILRDPADPVASTSPRTPPSCWLS